MAKRRLTDHQRAENRRLAKAKWLTNNREKRLEVQRAYNARAKAKRHNYYVATKERTMAQGKARRAKNPDLRKEEYARWKARTAPVVRGERHLKEKYGMTLADYNTMLAQQGGVCRLCGDTGKATKRGRTLDVDHDHETGAVRGLLCRPCNNGIGHLERFEMLNLLSAGRTYIAASKALTLVA